MTSLAQSYHNEQAEDNVQKGSEIQTNSLPKKDNLRAYMSVLATGPQDTFDEISSEDIALLKRRKYQIILFPIVSFLGITLIKKAVDFIRIPELLRNPLIPHQANVQRSKHFKTFMGNNITVLICTASLMAGFGVYELTKYFLYLKYKNLVESYLDAREKEYLHILHREGSQIDLTLHSSEPRN